MPLSPKEVLEEFQLDNSHGINLDILNQLPKAAIFGAVVDRGITCKADPCDAARGI